MTAPRPIIGFTFVRHGFSVDSSGVTTPIIELVDVRA